MSYFLRVYLCVAEISGSENAILGPKSGADVRWCQFCIRYYALSGVECPRIARHFTICPPFYKKITADSLTPPLTSFQLNI